MKRAVLLSLVLAFAIAGISQNQTLKSGLKTNKAPWLETKVQENHQAVSHPKPEIKFPCDFKNADVVNIVPIGTCSNGYNIGYAGGQRSLLNYMPGIDYDIVTFIHYMGGDLDPEGNAFDFGYDLSIDGGETWDTMIELYESDDTIGGYSTSQTTNLQGLILSLPGIHPPEENYIAYHAAYESSGMPNNGYLYGRGNFGDHGDTTHHYIYSNPGQGINLNTTKCIALDNYRNMWVVDVNIDPINFEWLNEIIITKYEWNQNALDFEFVNQFTLPCPGDFPPLDLEIEFEKVGPLGYIAALTETGEVPVSQGRSFYPVIWRTADNGETWSDPFEIPLAGEGGIEGVQNYLSDEELAELYDPVPPRDEIPFTTAFDFDLTIDIRGHPHIAVVVGITGEDPYSIITSISPSSRYMYTAAFLLSSYNYGDPGYWYGGLMGRLVSFRGTFDDISEDNRIQIASSSQPMVFVSWLDTDTTVSDENNAPDIWARGVNLNMMAKTANAQGEDLATNVTFGSEGTFSSYFYCMANWTMLDEYWSTTIPFVYQSMNPADPSESVQFKYIKDFTFDYDEYEYPAYIIVGQEEIDPASGLRLSVSEPLPNPVSSKCTLTIACPEPLTASVQITNLMGQNMKSFLSNLNAGNNEITFDVSGLESGIYFITIEAGGERISRKLVVE